MEFLSPSTLEPGRVHSPLACLTRYVPPSEFPTLSAVSSSPGPPALFHAGIVLGVRPSGVFPHCQLPRLIAASCPPGVRPFSTSEVGGLRSTWTVRKPPSGPCRQWIRSTHLPIRGRSPPELHPLQGIARRSPRVASHASTPVLLAPAVHDPETGPRIAGTVHSSVSNCAVPSSLEASSPHEVPGLPIPMASATRAW